MTTRLDEAERRRLDAEARRLNSFVRWLAPVLSVAVVLAVVLEVTVVMTTVIRAVADPMLATLVRADIDGLAGTIERKWGQLKEGYRKMFRDQRKGETAP